MDDSTAARPRLGWQGALLIVLVVALLLTAAGTLIILMVVETQLSEVEEQSRAIDQQSLPIDELARDFPFSPPGNGKLQSHRLYVFFAVIDEVAAVQGQLPVAADGQLQALQDTVVTSLRKHSMGPGEFIWIADASEAAWLKRARGFQGVVPEANLRLIDAWRPKFDTLFQNPESRRYGLVDLIRVVLGESGNRKVRGHDERAIPIQSSDSH